MKTKFRIMQSMMELLNDYSYEQITISMITEQVPIARQGFYKFYKSKEDLCCQMYIYFTGHAAVMAEDFTLHEFITHDLSEINRNMIFFYKLSWQLYEKDLFWILHDNIYRIYEKMICFRQEKKMSEDMSFLLDGYIIGCLVKLMEVLRKGEPMDVGKMTERCIAMMPQAVRDVLQEGKYPASIITESVSFS